MKRKITMPIVALSFILALSSCTGVPGASGPMGPAGSNGQDGTDGKDGATWVTGTGVPSADEGATGDLYLDTENYDIYVKNDSGWELTGNIKGDKGDQGETGPQGPAGSEGEQGPQGETGPQGEQGLPGENGSDGDDGATWMTGSGAPASDEGKTGDLYLDTATSDIYVKNASGWEIIGNIKGDQGETGAQGEQGPQGEKGEQGETGPQGDKGEQGLTAWSNTILPADGAYVTADKGSAVADGKETITFTAVDTDPDDGKTPYGLTLINNGVSESHDLDDNNQYTAVMKEGGFVVSIDFADELDTSESLNAVFDAPVGEGDNAFVLGAGELELNPTGSALNYAKSDRVVLEGSVDEEGNPTTTLKVGEDIDFNGAQNAGTLELKNLNIEMTASIPDYKLFMFNGGEDLVLENVNVSVNKTIDPSNGVPSVLYFNTPNADITVKDFTLDNTADPTYYDALQIWTAGTFTAENVKITNVDNPFTIHSFEAGDRFYFKNCDFETYSPIMFANEFLRSQKTKEDFDALKATIEVDRPLVEFEGCSIKNNYEYMAYYYVSDLEEETMYQADYSWLDLHFVDTSFNGKAFTEETYNGNKATDTQEFFEIYDTVKRNYPDGLTPNVTFGE